MLLEEIKFEIINAPQTTFQITILHFVTVFDNYLQ